MRAVAEKLRLSQIAPGLIQSEIRAMTVECDRMGGVNLAQGVCDTELPAPVADGAVDAIAEGRNIYTRADGIAPLRAPSPRSSAATTASRPIRRHEILVTSGATAGFHVACLALLDPGDEVILFEPFYGYHLNTLRAGRVTLSPFP